MKYVLRTENLTKTFGEKKAVDNVSISIKKGEIYGFIGKNGAGKTTLMRMVLGAAQPTSGSIELFDGEPLSSARRHIGSLLETPNLYKGCTAFENLKRFSLLTGNTDKELRVILHFVGLGKTGSKKVGQFSLGMKQRLGIAVAMLGHPDFLVLDEPINGLDPAGIKSIRDLLVRLNRELGMTILLSSHLLDELAKVVTTYGIIDNGVLLEEISARELESKCSRKLTVCVDEPLRAATIIREVTGDAPIATEGNTLILGTHLEDSAEINTALVSAGISVSEIKTQTGSLESYFFERIGG